MVSSVRSLLTIEQLTAKLRERVSLPDLHFDAHLPPRARTHSPLHFTPLAVATTIAAWIEDAGVRSVVDVGSGAGKFCVAAALGCGARFLGIERRPWLVDAARELAHTFGVEERVSFREAVFGLDELPAADAYYFYNPFGENLFGAVDQLDEDGAGDLDRFGRDVAIATDFLRLAPQGTLFLLYNGYGARVPEGLELIHTDSSLPNDFEVWRR